MLTSLYSIVRCPADVLLENTPSHHCQWASYLLVCVRDLINCAAQLQPHSSYSYRHLLQYGMTSVLEYKWCTDSYTVSIRGNSLWLYQRMTLSHYFCFHQQCSRQQLYSLLHNWGNCPNATLGCVHMCVHANDCATLGGEQLWSYTFFPVRDVFIIPAPLVNG